MGCGRTSVYCPPLMVSKIATRDLGRGKTKRDRVAESDLGRVAKVEMGIAVDLGRPVISLPLFLLQSFSLGQEVGRIHRYQLHLLSCLQTHTLKSQFSH